MKKILNNKYLILIPIIILNIISITHLHNTHYINKHLIYLFLSYIVLFISSKINFKFILKFIPYFYLICIFLLLLVLLIGREINGSKAWLHIFGISIQPSEITKLILTIYFSFLSYKRKSPYLLIILTIIPSLLTYLEPDTGAIIFYIIILLTSLKHLKIPRKTIIISTITILTFLTINITLFITNKDILTNIYGTNIIYRLERLTNYNNIQHKNSLISIGAHNYIYIPENHNDFIFSSIISKYQYTFPIILISYILIFTYYLKHINKKNNISNIINKMILNMLLFQVFYNILMNLSLLPIIGIPLPFLSYGGSYLITLYFLIGISINLINNNKVV